MGTDAFYRNYLQRCNEHRFGELGEFVAGEIEVNGVSRDLRWYGDGLAAVVTEIPDFHWELRHLLRDGDWLAAHLGLSGTTRAGRAVSGQEFAMYRLSQGLIVEVWGDLDRTRL